MKNIFLTVNGVVVIIKTNFRLTPFNGRSGLRELRSLFMAGNFEYPMRTLNRWKVNWSNKKIRWRHIWKFCLRFNWVSTNLKLILRDIFRYVSVHFEKKCEKLNNLSVENHFVYMYWLLIIEWILKPLKSETFHISVQFWIQSPSTLF